MVYSGMSEAKLEWQKWAILPERCLRRGTAGSKALQGHMWLLQAARKADRGGCREGWCEGIFIFCRDSTARHIDLGSSDNCPSPSQDHLSAIWRNELTPYPPTSVPLILSVPCPAWCGHSSFTLGQVTSRGPNICPSFGDVPTILGDAGACLQPILTRCQGIWDHRNETSASLDVSGQNGGLKMNCFLEDCFNSKPWLFLAFIISFRLFTFHLPPPRNGSWYKDSSTYDGIAFQ